MEGTSSSRPSSSTHHDDHHHTLVDDFYFSVLYDDEEIFPISDEKYAEELQLQEALYSSSAISTTTRVVVNNLIHVDTNVNTTLTNNLKQKQKQTNEDSSSSSSSFSFSHSKDFYYCGICMEVKPVEEMFKNQICFSHHSFCNDCVGSYLATKIQENISNVKCPDPKCSTVLEPYQCSSIIPKDVFDRWENALCENMVLGSKKFYCPFKDCSAMLVNEEEEVVTVSECPHCNRLFCAVCKVAWHSGVDCGEFQRLEKGERGREDLMAMELAKNKGWKRCPSCNFYVEKTEGCSHISCRCGYHFCYACGKSWSETHVC